MAFTSQNFPLDFWEVVRAVEKVQYGKQKNLIDLTTLKRCLHLQACAAQYGTMAWVDFIGAFSIKGYAFKRHCTLFSVSNTGGSVRWAEAPETLHGQGSRMKISIVNPNRESREILTSFPGFVEVQTGDLNQLTFIGE